MVVTHCISRQAGRRQMIVFRLPKDKQETTRRHPSTTTFRRVVEIASGSEFCVTLDLSEAYHQVVLESESRDLTTFSDGTALYRFKILPFGLNCSPAIFSGQIANVLATLNQRRQG